jgi:SSS family solute:Na+ symporter
MIVGSVFILTILGSAFTIGAVSNVFFSREYGVSAIEHVPNVDMIMPTFVNELLSNFQFGDIFVVVFMLALLAAAISTMSALFHVMGSSAGYDLKSEIDRKRGKEVRDSQSLKANRIGTLVMMVFVIVIAYIMPMNIIAKATSIFMGLTAATLLPSYAHSLYSKRPNLLAAKASIIVGSVSWVLWAFLMNKGIATALLGMPTIVTGTLWNFVDPLVVSLPLSVLAMILVLWLKPQTAAEAEPVADAGPSAE